MPILVSFRLPISKVGISWKTFLSMYAGNVAWLPDLSCYEQLSFNFAAHQIKKTVSFDEMEKVVAFHFLIFTRVHAITSSLLIFKIAMSFCHRCP
jgi:hypothetical protein